MSDSQTQVPARKRPHLPAIVALLLLLGGGAFLALRYYLHSRYYESTDDAFIEAGVVAISARVGGHVVSVGVEDNQDVRGDQVLFELDPRDFQSRVKQASAALAAAEARRAAATQAVAVTRTTSGAGVEQAQAGVTIAEAALRSAQAGVLAVKSRAIEAQAAQAAAEASASEASADVAIAQADATRTAADLERYRELIKSNSISQQQLDHATAAASAASARLEATRRKVAAANARIEQAKAGVATAAESVKQAESVVAEVAARVEQARAALASAKAAPDQVAASEAQAASAAADIEQARAALHQAELNLSYCTVRAPQAGRVTRKNVRVGAFVQAGQPTLAIVPREVWVVANFKETQLEHMKPGQDVRIDVDAFPAAGLKGRVDSIQHGTGSRFSLLPPENATGNFVKVVQRVPVKIVLVDPPTDALLSPGMSVVPRVRVR